MGILKEYYSDFIFVLSSAVTSAPVGRVRLLSDSPGVPEGRASAAALSARDQRHSSERTAGTPGRTEQSEFTDWNGSTQVRLYLALHF